jgi:hypothetical protein
MEKNWTQKPLIEHIDHVWYEHGNLFSSQIREQMDGDDRAMKLVNQFEKGWRELRDYVLNEIEDHRKKIRKEKKRKQIKERLKPFIHKKLLEMKKR